MISRKELAEEIRFRECVFDAIKIVQNKLIKREILKLNEEIQFREAIQDLILEAATDDPKADPHPATGINVLEDLLKKIVPIIETDFKVLTTSEDQRISFRAHIIHAVKNTLAPIDANEKADEESDGVELREGKLDEDVDINIEDRDEQEKFIDIDGDGKPDEEEEKDPREQFGIDGEDETGRNGAYNCFKKIENQIVDAYSLLGNEEDQGIFYDYLVTNLKLYFDKFETELQTTLSEPTTDAYEQEKTATEDPAGSEESGLPGDL